MICTRGSNDAQETPVTVCVVGLPAASVSVKNRPKGAAPGQLKEMQVEVLTAVTATQLLAEEPPSATHRFFCAPTPSELLRPAASGELVWAQAWNEPGGPKNCPLAGLLTVRTGGVKRSEERRVGKECRSRW